MGHWKDRGWAEKRGPMKASKWDLEKEGSMVESKVPPRAMHSEDERVLARAKSTVVGWELRWATMTEHLMADAKALQLGL